MKLGSSHEDQWFSKNMGILGWCPDTNVEAFPKAMD
jgi:hypothetical protein